MHNLDMKHQSASHQYNLVVKDEESRRLKLRSVLLEDEKETLKDNLSRTNDKLRRLTIQCDTFRGDLESSAQAGRQQETQIRVQARELSNLKVKQNIPRNPHFTYASSRI